MKTVYVTVSIQDDTGKPILSTGKQILIDESETGFFWAEHSGVNTPGTSLVGAVLEWLAEAHKEGVL